MNELKNENLNIYNKNKDAKVVTPNPATTTTAVTGGQPLPVVDSFFIQNYLGPNGTANTMTD